MRRLIPAMALLLALAAPGFADPPKAAIRGKATVRPGGSIVLDASASVSDRPLQWKVLQPSELIYTTWDKGNRQGVALFVPDVDPGTYRFALVAVGNPEKPDAEIPIDVAIFEVAVAEPGPQPIPPPFPPPGPDPTPPPGPTPGPVAGQLHATLIYDADVPAASLVALRANPAVRDRLAQWQSIWRACDVDSATVRNKGLAPVVQAAGGPPCLVVQDATGRVLAATKLRADATDATVAELIRPLRGGS